MPHPALWHSSCSRYREFVPWEIFVSLVLLYVFIGFNYGTKWMPDTIYPAWKLSVRAYCLDHMVIQGLWSSLKLTHFSCKEAHFWLAAVSPFYLTLVLPGSNFASYHLPAMQNLIDQLFFLAQCYSLQSSCTWAAEHLSVSFMYDERLCFYFATSDFW